MVGPLVLAGGEVSLWVELSPSHPYLDEHDRTLVVTRGTAAVRKPLLSDSGGYGRLNIYLHSPHSAIVKGPFEELLVHFDPLQVEELPKPVQVPGKYLAALARDATGTWRFIPAAEASEMPLGVSR
jgi:hypothetical protein